MVINIKKILTGLFALLVALTVVSVAYAAPNNQSKAENNPNVVAYYEDGLHAIPTDPIQYLEGTNLVTRRGNDGQIQAWYTGADGTGYHSVWNYSKDGTCSGDWVLIENAYPGWGDYLTPDADYCVKVNAF